MAGIDEEVAANKPGAAGPRPDAATACDEEADPAAEYMAVSAPFLFATLTVDSKLCKPGFGLTCLSLLAARGRPPTAARAVCR